MCDYLYKLEPIKTYLANSIKGKKVHFRCDCVLGIDVIGDVIDWEMYQNEIIWTIKIEDKTIKIGENHPNMNMEIL